jgi:hypothetical protein
MGVIVLTRSKWLIALGLLVVLGVGCGSKPDDTPAPERRTNTISVQVYMNPGQPIVTFTVDLKLTNAITGKTLRHAITGEPSIVKVTRSTRKWTGTFTYWGDDAPVRLVGNVTWTDVGELLGVKVFDNKKEIREAGHFDATGKITIFYTTSGA